MAITVEELYKNFGVLADAKDKAGEHEAEYKSILSATKSGASEKRLAAQFIPRFFKYFPHLSDQAIDAQTDLCEDSDVSIRKQAIKDLPIFCKDTKENTPKIAGVLAQLLCTQDAGELSIVHNSLMTLFKGHPKDVIKGLFLEINSDEDASREAAIKFLTTKIKQIPEEVMVKDVEDYLIQETKKTLEDVTGEEFVAFMKMLSAMPTMTTMQGRKELVDIVAEQAELDSPFDAAEPDNVDKLTQCIRQALPFFSKNVHSTKFVVYMCDNVLPVLSNIAKPEGSGDDVDVQLDVLKLFAELSVHCGVVENLENKIGKLFNKLVEHMPFPPSDEDGENKTPDDEPQLQFSYVECLMFAFHQLARKCPDFLASEKNAEKLKDFRVRLQYFARGVQIYIKQLRAALQGKTGDALKTEENKLKVVALKITNNINVLIKDLFHNPPSYKSVVSLSWKPVGKALGTTQPSPGQKRSGFTPIRFEGGDAKRGAHGPRQLYQIPTGKWSDSAGTYQAPRGRGFRGAFRGGFRGRGRGRGWRGNRY